METSSLTYLLGHPDTLGATVLRPWLLWLALAVPIFFAWRRAPRWTVTLRTAAFLALIGALSGLCLTTLLPSDRLTLIAAVDVSESIDDAGREWARRYVDELAGALAPGDELGVVTFATDTSITMPPSSPGRLEALSNPTSRTATDIGRAIDTAMALFPADAERRLLLITDGNETRGDCRSRVPHLREAKVRVDAAIPPHRTAPDVSVAKVVVAPIVAEDAVASLRVVAFNSGKERPAVFTLYLDDTIVDSAAVDLASGLQTLEVPLRLAGRGSHHLRAQLETPDDPTPGNNYREVPIMVGGKPRVLLVTSRAHSTVAGVLGRKGVAVDVVPPRALPRRAGDLLDYHCVVFEDITADDLSEPALTALERYVRVLGGGLIFAGGAATYGDVRLRETALKRMLPVTLEPLRPRQNEREPLALFIVIDRSNSMGYNSRIGTLRDGEKLRYAKEAALAVIRQLKDQDLVGLIVFDSQPSEISPLQPLRENRRTLEDLIPRLVENGGTDFYDALISARQQLESSRVNRKHIILLTDGDTNRAAADHYPLISQLAQAKISVTTLRIGDNTINLKLLRDISEQTGGQFHYVDHIESLPDLMLQETTKAMGPSAADHEEYFPEAGRRSQLLRGITAKKIPPLGGYAFAKVKSGADVPLQVARLERRDPLLAVWRYGLGRVAAFTASPYDDAETWPAWSEFGKFWSQLVHWSVADQTAGDYLIEARKQGGQTELSVRTFDPSDDEAVLLARLHVSDEDIRDVGLVPEGLRRFSGRLPDLPAGRYPLTIIRRSDGRDINQRAELLTIPDKEDEPQEEHQEHGPNRALLTQLVESTGGSIDPTVRDLTTRHTGTRPLYYPLDHLLAPLAMLLFLADVAIRRLAPPPTRGSGRDS